MKTADPHIYCTSVCTGSTNSCISLCSNQITFSSKKLLTSSGYGLGAKMFILINVLSFAKHIKIKEITIMTVQSLSCVNIQVQLWSVSGETCCITGCLCEAVRPDVSAPAAYIKSVSFFSFFFGVCERRREIFIKTNHAKQTNFFFIIFALRFMSFYTQIHQSYEQFLFSSAYCETKIATLFSKIIYTNLQICWFSLLSQTCFYFVRSLATLTFAPDLLLVYQSHIYRRAIGQLAMASSSTNLHPSQMKRKYQAPTTFTIK